MDSLKINQHTDINALREFALDKDAHSLELKSVDGSLILYKTTRPEGAAATPQNAAQNQAAARDALEILLAAKLPPSEFKDFVSENDLYGGDIGAQLFDAVAIATSKEGVAGDQQEPGGTAAPQLHDDTADDVGAMYDDFAASNLNFSIKSEPQVGANSTPAIDGAAINQPGASVSSDKVLEAIFNQGDFIETFARNADIYLGPDFMADVDEPGSDAHKLLLEVRDDVRDILIDYAGGKPEDVAKLSAAQIKDATDFIVHISVRQQNPDWVNVSAENQEIEDANSNVALTAIYNKGEFYKTFESAARDAFGPLPASDFFEHDTTVGRTHLAVRAAVQDALLEYVGGDPKDVAKLPAEQIKAATNFVIKQYFDDHPFAQIEGSPDQQHN